MFQHQHISRVLMIVGSGVAFFFGGWSDLLTALIILQGLDIFLGILNAGKRKEISSRALLIGLERKLGIWISLILANVIDSVVFSNQPVIMTGLLFSFIGYEGLSIVENLALINVPLPSWLTKLLIQVQIMHDDRINSAIEGLDPNSVDKVIVKTKQGGSRVVAEDMRSKRVREALCEQCDDCKDCDK